MSNEQKDPPSPEAVIKHMLNTPPPKKGKEDKKEKPAK